MFQVVRQAPQNSPLVRVGGISAPELDVVELVDAEPVAVWVVALEIGIANELDAGRVCSPA